MLAFLALLPLRQRLGRPERAHTLGAIVIMALIAAGCAGRAGEPTEDDTAANYAAVIRQIYTQDDTFGGTLQPPTLYILGTTDDRAGEPGEGEANAEFLSEALRDGVTTALADLPAALVWVETQDDVPLEPDTGAVVDGGAVITLGSVTPQRGGSVHVPASIYVANLAAGGQTYVLEKVDGVWTVTGTTGVQWIS
jgi:hypothetical protein